MHRTSAHRFATIAVAVVAASCGSDELTAIRLRIVADPALALDHVQVRVAGELAVAPVRDELDVAVPDAAADTPLVIEVWGIADGAQRAFGSGNATPRYHRRVPADVTLRALECQAPCQIGETRCEGAGTSSCVGATGGCAAWSEVTDCPRDRPFCDAGACAAECRDECAEGEVTCAGESGTQACGERDGDPCRDWLPVVACPARQRCAAGACRSCTTRELLVNGGFDASPLGTGWTETRADPAAELIIAEGTTGAVAASSPPNLTWLGGYNMNAPATDAIHQDVGVPTGTVAIELTGMRHIQNDEATPPPPYTSRVALTTPTGTEIQALFDADAATMPQGVWHPLAATVTSASTLAGQTVRLHLGSTTQMSTRVSFFFDTLSLTATVCE